MENGNGLGPATTAMLALLKAFVAELESAASKPADDPNADMVPLAELPCTVRTAREMIKAGKLPATKIGRAYLVKRADVERVFAPKLATPKPKTSKPKTERGRFAAALAAKGIA